MRGADRGPPCLKLPRAATWLCYSAPHLLERRFPEHSFGLETVSAIHGVLLIVTGNGRDLLPQGVAKS